MAAALTSSVQSATSGLWAQMQQQLAQRNADQAEQQASALRARAQSAQVVADRAQENARSLKVQSNQAQGEASEARRGLAAQASVSEVQSQFADLREQISEVLQSDPIVASLPPVVNTSGQETGTVVNVTA